MTEYFLLKLLLLENPEKSIAYINFEFSDSYFIAEKIKEL